MKIICTRITAGFFSLSVSLACAQADNLSATSMDLVAPEIREVNVPDKAYSGSALKIEAKVVDNQGLKSVAVFFRHTGSRQYTKQEMPRGPGNNDYISVIKNVSGEGIEYYIEAIDLAGNLIRDGQDFSPHSIKVLSELDSSIITNLQPGPLDDQAILALFSNNTVDGYHLRKYFNFTRYFAADGRLMGTNKIQGKRIGRWRVKNKKLCERFGEQKETCREIVKEGDKIKKYTTTRNGDRVVAIVYKRFRYGNPENF